MDWTTSKMERLHWVQWPDADVAHLFESVTGVKVRDFFILLFLLVFLTINMII